MLAHLGEFMSFLYATCTRSFAMHKTSFFLCFFDKKVVRDFYRLKRFLGDETKRGCSGSYNFAVRDPQ